MKPREWAALGFRLLSVYLFVQAMFGGIATLYFGAVWIFSKPTFDGSLSSEFYLMIQALVGALQATVVGYWYWFDADKTSDPRGMESVEGGTVDPIAPLLTLAVAAWGVFGFVAAMRRVVGLWAWQQTSGFDAPASNLLLHYLLIELAAYTAFAMAPRTIVGILLWCTPGSGRAMPEPNEATSA